MDNKRASRRQRWLNLALAVSPLSFALIFLRWEHQDADPAFRRLRWVHLGFMTLPFVLALMVFRWEAQDTAARIDFPPEAAWVARGFLVLLSVAGLLTIRMVASAPNFRPLPWTSSAPLAVQRAVALSSLRMAFSAALSIYGLLVYFLGGNLIDVLAFGAASLLALAWNRPKRGDWDNLQDAPSAPEPNNPSSLP